MKKRSARKKRHRRRFSKPVKKESGSLVTLSDHDIEMLTKKDYVTILKEETEEQSVTYNADEIQLGCTNLRWDYEDEYEKDRRKTDEEIRKVLRKKDARFNALAENYKHLFQIFTSRTAHMRQLDLVLFINSIQGRVKTGIISEKMGYEICVARQHYVLGKLQKSLQKRQEQQVKQAKTQSKHKAGAK